MIAITYDGATPTVGADADTWGAELNVGALAKIKVDLDALAGQGNATETVAGDALPKAGGTMTGDIALADPTPASASSAGFRGIPTTSIDADYTFVAKDAGKCVRLTGTTARTWTIPPDVLPVGQVIILRNFSTQSITLARGAGVELRAPGSSTDGNKTIISHGYASVLQEALNVWVASGIGVS